MAKADSQTDTQTARLSPLAALWPNGWLGRIVMVVLAIALVTLAGLWFNRENIAGNVIEDALAEQGLVASYEIESIGPQRQVLRNLVIGEADAPDFTADSLAVDLEYGLGVPSLGAVEIENARLFGSYRDGSLSFGSLDPVLFAESDGPPALPQIALAVRDARARIDSDFGVIGIKLDGEGQLDDGFVGTLAATAPGIGAENCRAATATAYGALTIEDSAMSFDGPVRLRELSCSGAQIVTSDIGAALTLAPDFSSVQGAFALVMGELAFAESTADTLEGAIDLAANLAPSNDDRGRPVILRHDVTVTGIASPSFGLSSFSADGNASLAFGFEQWDWNANFGGSEVSIRALNDTNLATARAAGAQTLVGGLLSKLERGLRQSLRGNQLSGNIAIRSDAETTSAIIPQMRLRSASDETLLSVSRLSFARESATSNQRLSGSFLTGGTDLPQINARVDQSLGRDLGLRLSIAEYREGDDAIAVPAMQLRQDGQGQILFDGVIEAQGAIPGGQVEGLTMPIKGSWNARNGLALGRECTPLRFTRLQASGLTLDEQELPLCPAEGASALVRYNDGLQLAAETRAIRLEGDLAGTAMRVDADSARIAINAPVIARNLRVVLGEDGSAVRLTAAELIADIGDAIGGHFNGGTAALDVVPLDISDLSGNWSYGDDGALTLSDGAFSLTERIGEGWSPEARFERLASTGANLQLVEGIISADADLRHPTSGTLITKVTIGHALSSGEGRADIAVPGIHFDDNFQPDQLTDLVTGVIALAEGTVSGNGQVQWTANSITSWGSFGTDNFDFAAAFGPVNDVRGEIVFTDLINLTTAPNQVIEIGSVNPGVEALGGRIVYSIDSGEVVRVEDGRWPFMGGELILRPTAINYGDNQTDGGQSYVFELVELDAATFVAQMELGNLGATGTFDGSIPIYFDGDGNGFIRGGLLISRPPGGNVSYVGELTYEDLGAISNFAFQSLRSLDFNQMSVELNGSLAGEIVTNFQIDGVRQGESADRNFVTRELGKLPIRFKINVRSDNFYTLALIVRGLFDPTYFANAAEIEKFVAENLEQLQRPDTPVPEDSPSNDEIQRRDEALVQPPESEDMP